MKTETWNGHGIRFIERDSEWWAVAKDVADALGYKHAPHMVRYIDKKDLCAVLISDTTYEKAKARDAQEMTVVSEFGIYDAVFRSTKPEAKEFKRWVFDVLKALRQASGLEGFEVFRMLDKDHQKEAMDKLRNGLAHPVKVDYIKANTIANKAVSMRHGFKKMVKKPDMTPEMLADRQGLLEETVVMMVLKERHGMEFSVSEKIYALATRERLAG